MNKDWFLQALFYFLYISIAIFVIWLVWFFVNLLAYKLSGSELPAKRSNEFSFSWVPKFLTITFLAISSIAVAIYQTTDSFDVTVSIFAMFAAFNLAGIIGTVHAEYLLKQNKDRNVDD